MCGIAGIYGSGGAPVERARLERMAAVMRHRGPDDDGFLADGAFGMAMRRLSIIDLETGAQPICNEDGAVSVVFNGEIYNHLELRAGLEARGHKFRTRSDTEVIVHLYEEHGAALANHLNGMFAIAVWDSTRRRLTLIRDRLGIKPLYWTLVGEEFLFGSEIKCLTAAADVPRGIDAAALDSYLQTQYFPFDKTILSAVKKLRPGHYMVVENGGIRIERYWEIKFPAAHEHVDEREAINRFGELFFKSVERRLMSDVPLGVFLSGGIDSSAVAAAMSEITGKSIKTFTIGFGPEAREYSELEASRVAAVACGAQAHERVVAAGEVAERLDRILDHFDEPFGGGLHTYLVSELAAPHVKVSLTGIGADELLGGYERQKKLRLVRAYALLPGAARAAARRAADLVSGSDSVTAKLKEKFLKLDRIASACDRDVYFEWIAVFSDALKRRLYRPGFYYATAVDPIGAQAERVFGAGLPSDPDDRISFLELKTTLPDDFLNYTDRMSMAWGLEARVPFLDHELVEYVASLPMDLKVRGGVTKYILKKAVADLLPRSIIERRKQPFLLPLGIWFRGPLRPLVEKTLLGGELAAAEYLEPSAVRELATLHLNGRRDLTWQLWSLVLFERWCRNFL